MGKGSGSGSILWSILWLLVLIFIAFPVAGFCAGWHILFQPFSVCIQGCEPIMEILLKGVMVPKLAASGMMSGKSFSEAA